jgi:hypothetical protein
VVSVLCLAQRDARAADPSGAGESAAAPSSASSAERARLTLALGTEIAFGMSDARQAGNLDVIVLERMDQVGLNAAARYRVLDALALGVRFSWGSELGARGSASSAGESAIYDRNLIQLALEGRYQPGVHGWFAAVRGGTAAIIDTVDSQSVTQWGPLGGLVLGYDLRVVGAFALGFELQGTLIGFSEEGTRAPAGYVYGTSSWLGLGLVGSLGI